MSMIRNGEENKQASPVLITPAKMTPSTNYNRRIFFSVLDLKY